MAQFDDVWISGAEHVIVDVFKSFRAELMSAFGDVVSTIKANNTVVTELDKKVEVVLRKQLLDYDDSVGLLGEEFGTQGSTSTKWLIDPIDGTEQFARGIPTCKNMVTLIHESLPVMTVVYRFPTDDLYIGTKGKGATKNGEKISVSARPLNLAQVEFSSNFGSLTCGELVNLFHQKAGGHRSHDWLTVVEGLRDVHCVYGSGGGDWDYAPRMLLLQEAGAKVANIGRGRDAVGWNYKNHDFLATNPVVFDELFALVQKCITKS